MVRGGWHCRMFRRHDALLFTIESFHGVGSICRLKTCFDNSQLSLHLSQCQHHYHLHTSFINY